MSKVATIIFIKEPKEGLVKTRLCKHFDAKFVVALYRLFVEDILETLDDFSNDVFVFYYPKEGLETLQTWLGKREFVLQKGEDLGERMYNAFIHVFEQGFEKVLIVGSDSPQLSQTSLNETVQALETQDVVFGPSFDGGYYLAAYTKKSFSKVAFLEMQWSVESVLQESLKRLAGKSIYLLKPLQDIDAKEDLERFYAEYKQSNLKSIHYLRGLYD